MNPKKYIIYLNDSFHTIIRTNSLIKSVDGKKVQKFKDYPHKLVVCTY